MTARYRLMYKVELDDQHDESTVIRLADQLGAYTAERQHDDGWHTVYRRDASAPSQRPKLRHVGHDVRHIATDEFGRDVFQCHTDGEQWAE